MKKIFLIILIFIIVSGASAQQLKLMGGPTISNYSDPWPSGVVWFADTGYFRSPFQNSKTGFLEGIGIEFALNKSIAFELDALYFQKGSTFDLPSYWYPRKEIYYMKGISFPLLVKAKFLPRPFPYITGGGEFSLILSHSRIIREESMIDGYYERREDLLKDTNKIDFGFVFGTGFEVKVSKVVCFLEARYNLGQRNLYPWPEIIYDYPPIIKTCALQIIGGFKI